MGATIHSEQKVSIVTREGATTNIHEGTTIETVKAEGKSTWYPTLYNFGELEITGAKITGAQVIYNQVNSVTKIYSNTEMIGGDTDEWPTIWNVGLLEITGSSVQSPASIGIVSYEGATTNIHKGTTINAVQRNAIYNAAESTLNISKGTKITAQNLSYPAIYNLRTS